MVITKSKPSSKEQDFFKKTCLKHICPTIASKRLVIIEILFLSIVYHATIIPYKKLLNSPKSKYKIQVIPIIYIIKIINIFKANIRQARQIENSRSSSENKVKFKNLENIISSLLMELSHFSIHKFCDIFKDEALMKRLNIYKNVDKYEKITGFFYVRLTLFI